MLLSRCIWSLFALSLAAALFQSFLALRKVQLGYEIGRLKGQEIGLLRKKSLLTVELSKLTSRETLERRLGIKE